MSGRLRRGEITRRCVAFNEKKKKKRTRAFFIFPSFSFNRDTRHTVYEMEGILVPINEKKSVRGMLSTREHISRSKTNDVSPFRKNISGVKDTRRAWRGEIRRGGEGGDLEAGVVVFHRRSIRGSKSIGLSDEVDPRCDPVLCNVVPLRFYWWNRRARGNDNSK